MSATATPRPASAGEPPQPPDPADLLREAVRRANRLSELNRMGKGDGRV
ncbi:hypothetical protein [Streptomyces sp. RFCAC02]|nr:hypothetical protein [Streptomyces sp. RFCAC02]